MKTKRAWESMRWLLELVLETDKPLSLGEDIFPLFEPENERGQIGNLVVDLIYGGLVNGKDYGSEKTTLTDLTLKGYLCLEFLRFTSKTDL